MRKKIIYDKRTLTNFKKNTKFHKIYRQKNSTVVNKMFYNKMVQINSIEHK